MNDLETRRLILSQLDKPMSHFGFVTDPCGYDQHVKFVEYRNTYWQGQCKWADFLKEYADTLDFPATLIPKGWRRPQ